MITGWSSSFTNSYMDDSWINPFWSSKNKRQKPWQMGFIRSQGASFPPPPRPQQRKTHRPRSTGSDPDRCRHRGGGVHPTGTSWITSLGSESLWQHVKTAVSCHSCLSLFSIVSKGKKYESLDNWSIIWIEYRDCNNWLIISMFGLITGDWPIVHNGESWLTVQDTQFHSSCSGGWQFESPTMGCSAGHGKGYIGLAHWLWCVCSSKHESKARKKLSILQTQIFTHLVYIRDVSQTHELA